MSFPSRSPSQTPLLKEFITVHETRKNGDEEVLKNDLFFKGKFRKFLACFLKTTPAKWFESPDFDNSNDFFCECKTVQQFFSTRIDNKHAWHEEYWRKFLIKRKAFSASQLVKLLFYFNSGEKRVTFLKYLKYCTWIFSILPPVCYASPSSRARAIT